ncbi:MULTISPECIES: HAD-IA family hydrolase [unclassified Streptomyces]|uniref:HAD-IA family hydrolase n=1 Tax=unclassified Streptomyces TaxID=2593676 RepID=UPI00386659A1
MRAAHDVRPRNAQRGLQRRGVRPETCLFIDDVAVNVAAAQAAGMQAHLFEDNARTITRIAAHLNARPLAPEWVPLG